MPPVRLTIFISSVQKEFAHVRQDLREYILNDAFLKRFIADVFLFENLPAKDRRADEVYLEEVRNCDLYVGLFGDLYGREDDSGVSATEQEYDEATEHGKPRFIYVWGRDDSSREPKMRNLIQKASDQLVRRRVDNFTSLAAEVYASLVAHLECIGSLQTVPFDADTCPDASIEDLSEKRIAWFLQTASEERRFALGPGTSKETLLTHLNLCRRERITNAALLLFGHNPQAQRRCAEIKCMHCHGATYTRPFLSQQIYAGDIFTQVDLAREFVLSRIDRTVGERTETVTAAAEYELPADAVAEAIVNAVAHRDYYNNGSVEIRLFSDRLEIWTPGALPGNLSPESLLVDHASVPNNPLLAEALYLVRYIEKAGTGTQAILRRCREAGLPQPVFEQRGDSFVVTMWRHWLTETLLAQLGLSDRQKKLVVYVQEHGSITNAQFQKQFDVAKRTASRDLKELCERNILEKVGAAGPGVFYRLRSDAVPKGP